MSIKDKIFKNKIIKFLIIFPLLFISSNSYILIQLKKFENENISNNKKFTPKALIENLFNQYYTFLHVAIPSQKTETQLSMEIRGLSMNENICLTSNYYDKNKSISLSQTLYFDYISIDKEHIIVNETIEFSYYNTTSNEISQITIPNFIFRYNKINDTRKEGEREKLEKEIAGKACFFLGFQIQANDEFFIRSIPSIFKKRKLTNSSNFNFLFYDKNNDSRNKNDYDASILIGENPHEYNKEKYNLKNYVTAKALEWIEQKTWILEFQNYFYDKNGTKIFLKLNKYRPKIKGIFLFDLEYIIGIYDYYKFIKKVYFDNYKNECTINLIETFTIFTCEKNFSTENFPTLYFYQEEFKYTFELTHKDLFKVIGDKKYFLIIFDSNSNYPWKFGKLFMNKYFFNFDYDQMEIGFYKDLNDNNSKGNNIENLIVILGIIWSVLLIITAIGCFFLGKFIYKKKRRKRFNEIDDKYEYNQKQLEESFTNNNNNYKLGINLNTNFNC